MNKVWNKILIIVLIISLMLNVIITLKFNNVTEDINRNFGKLNYLQRNIDGLSKDIDELDSKQDWISSKQYKILQIDKNYEYVTIMLYGTLKELENNSKAYLLYGKIDKDLPEEIKWNKVPLSIDYGLRFTKKLRLPYRENYKFKIVAEGPSKSKSEDLLYIFFKDELKNRIFTYMFGESNSKDKDNLRLDVNIDNDYKGQEKLKIKNIKINLYADDNLVKTIEIYKDGKIIKNDRIKEIPIYDKSNKLVDIDDGNREKLSYDIKIKRDFREKNKIKFEMILEDYMGEKFKDEYPKIK